MANYRNDFADVNLETGTICRNFMNHSIGSGDALGDRFGVRVFRNGEPVSLGGTCAGYFVRNTTGETVVISSGVVSGNEAYVTLPAACYAVEGSFTLAIKVTSGSETVTMRIIDGVVSRTNTSVTVDPGTLVPSIETLISAINSAVGQIPVNYNASFAPAYSASSTYAVGDYVVYDGYLWRCTTAITETESWTAAHWTKVALASDVSDLKSALEQTNNDLFHFEDTGILLVTRGEFGRDIYNPNNGSIGTTRPYRISARKVISFPYEVTIKAKSGYQFLYYSQNSQTGNWAASSWMTEHTFAANQRFYMQITKSPEVTTETADIIEYINALSVSGGVISEIQTDVGNINTSIGNIESEIEDMGKVVYSPEIEDVESGRYAYAEKQADSKRLRTTKIVPVNKGDKIIVYSPTMQFYVGIVASMTASSYLQSSVTWQDTSKSHKEYVLTSNYDGYAIVNVRKQEYDEQQGQYVDVTITVSDYDGYIYVAENFNIPEKAVHVYQFGGNGNDWCFVRTPLNYDPKRAKPYPFVICNHGNGWAMDGTAGFANWTNRTMYVPVVEDNADIEQYYDAVYSEGQWSSAKYNKIISQGSGESIETSDPSLWYSNPTIEALLTAGYIVCGCENYGDQLYGNNNCRNACVDFFCHMVKTYNVEDRCYMIGASNGAMTSLNASYLLQGAVKALILQYPLTCLVNQYEHPGANASGHPAEIRTAYGITDADITEEELTKAVATHDPLTVDVVDGKKVGVFPPTKLYYSKGDTVVNWEQNTKALADMLDASNKVVETVQCSGNHGNHSHFAPSDYVAWFDTN